MKKFIIILLILFSSILMAMVIDITGNGIKCIISREGELQTMTYDTVLVKSYFNSNGKIYVAYKDGREDWLTPPKEKIKEVK